MPTKVIWILLWSKFAYMGVKNAPSITPNQDSWFSPDILKTELSNKEVNEVIYPCLGALGQSDSRMSDLPLFEKFSATQIAASVIYPWWVTLVLFSQLLTKKQKNRLPPKKINRGTEESGLVVVHLPLYFL